jgi:type IV pilus assembly protein PilM
MATKVLGIEIGENLIKVCETNMGAGARRVSGCAVFQTPPNAVTDGEISDLDAVAAVIKENLHKAGLRNKKAVFTIASSRIATREVILPPVRDTKLKTLVEANASDYFPVDMSNYQIAHTLIDRKAAGQDAGCRVLVMAAPVSILEGYFTLAKLLGFQIQALDYIGNSQYRLFETLPADGVTMYVDIDTSFSITTVVRKNRLLMQRLFPSGIDDYVLGYMSGADKSPDDYLASIRELSSEYFMPEYGQTFPMSELSDNLSRLVGIITRIADYFNSSNWETPIDKLVLTGVGSSVVGLKSAIAEATGLAVTILPKLEKVSAPGGLALQLPQYISCLGSAVAPVDLIPERYSKKKKETRKKKESISLGVTLLVVCLLGASGLSASAYLNYMDALVKRIPSIKRLRSLLYGKYLQHLSGLQQVFRRRQILQDATASRTTAFWVLSGARGENARRGQHPVRQLYPEGVTMTSR